MFHLLQNYIIKVHIRKKINNMKQTLVDAYKMPNHYKTRYFLCAVSQKLQLE